MAIQGKDLYSSSVQKTQDEIIANNATILKQMEGIVKVMGKNSGQTNKLSTSTDNLNKDLQKLKNNQNQLVRNTKTLTKLQETKAKKTDLETAAGRKLLKEQVKLNAARSKARAAIQKQLGVQNKLTKSFQSAALKLGVYYAAIKGAIKIIGSVIKTSANFEKQMDKVAAVTGATSEEMDSLSESAKHLGSTSSKTASEVGKLQEEFAKLGFTTSEILNATEATIRLSEATGSDLAQSAKVAGSTIRGFGLSATETQRIVDVMATSFSSSALDINKFETAMAQVAPVAKTTGIEIEEATAMLSSLVDAGLDASTAGTSLRNILLENAKNGRSFAESMDILNNASDKSSEAMKLFGKRGAVAAIVLSDNIEKTKELTKAYDEAEGSAAAMAKTVQDNLTGDVTKLQSAWEGFVLSVDDGGGVISKVVRNTIKFTTILIQKLTDLNKSAEEIMSEETLNPARASFKKFKEEIEDGLTLDDKIIAFSNQTNKLNEELILHKRRLQNLNDAVETKEREYREAGLAGAKGAGKAELEKIQYSKINIELINNKLILFKSELENLQALREKEKIAHEEKVSEEEEFYQLKKSNQEEFLESKKATNLEVKESDQDIFLSGVNQEKELAAIRKKLADERAFSIQRNKELAINAGFETLSVVGAIYSREEELLNRKYDNQVQRAEKAGEDTEKIEQERAVEVAKIRRKQAIIEKTAALADIAINTALGVTKVTAQTGVGAAIAIPLVVASGVAQAAKVLIEPLPEIPSFFKGGDHGGGLAEIHGQEIVSTPKGDFFTNWGKHEGKLIDLPESTIIPNKDIIQQDLNNITKIDTLGGITENKMAAIMEKAANKISSGINSQPHQTVTHDSIVFISKGGMNKTKYLNKRYRY